MAMGTQFVGGYGAGLRERELEHDIAMDRLNRYQNNRRRAAGGGGGGSRPFPQGSGVTFGADTVEPAEGAPRAYSYAPTTTPEERMKEKKLSTYEQDRLRGMEKEDREYGLKEREQTLEETKAKSEMGLKEKEEARAAEKHKNVMSAEEMALDKAKRADEHKKMMDSFMSGDVNGVMGWFILNTPLGKDGSMKIPVIKSGAQPGTYDVWWPGMKEGETETMERDDLGRILMRLSPKWEAPTSEKEIAETEYLRTGKGKGLMTPAEAEKSRISWGKEYAAGGQDFVEGYGAYPGAQGTEAPAPATVVPRGLEEPPKVGQGPVMTGRGEQKQLARKPQRDRKTGIVKLTYTDGSIVYKDRNGQVLRTERR